MRGRAPLRSPLRSPPLLFLLPLLPLLPLPVLGSARAAATETSPSLPAPENVEVLSYNFQSLLRWSPVAVENGSVLYTAHYQTAAFKRWSGLGCTRTPHTHCGLPAGLGRRWSLLLCVRAELGRRVSPWACSPPFVAEANTTLGPPRVNSVSVSPDSLLISVSPPFTPEPQDFPLYLVSYWENSTNPTEKKLTESKTLFQIGNLKESTLYCFSIQVQLQIFSGHFLRGERRAPECHRTALSEATRVAYFLPLLLLGLVVLSLVTLALLCLYKHRREIKHWARPPLRIPAHFEEFLREPGLGELDSPAEEQPHVLVLGEGSFSQSLQGQESH